MEKGFSWERGLLGFLVFGDDTLFEMFIKQPYRLLGEKDREILVLRIKELLNRVEIAQLRRQVEAFKNLLEGKGF